jgi:hypothetical protein
LLKELMDMDDDDDGEERVGYGKPPRHTRFKPGHSGNRKGRPKGAESRKAIVKRVAGEMHRVIEHGKPRWRSTLELVLLVLRTRAGMGDVKAFPTFCDLLARFGAEPPDHNDGAYIFMFMPEPLTPEELAREAEKSRQHQQALKEDYEARVRSETPLLRRRKS